MKLFNTISENKLADITDSIRRHIGIINPNSTVTSQEKSRAAKIVSSDHNISLDSASKFVNDYCKMKQTRLGENYSKRLTKLLEYRNKVLANESFESDKQLLDHHVTNNEPTLSNINKMHDMVRKIYTTHGVSSDKIYNQVVDNTSAHPKFREAASL